MPGTKRFWSVRGAVHRQPLWRLAGSHRARCRTPAADLRRRPDGAALPRANDRPRRARTCPPGRPRHPAAQTSLLGLSLDRLDIRVRQAEVMADLVHEHVCNHCPKRLLVLGPIIQDWTAV